MSFAGRCLHSKSYDFLSKPNSEHTADELISVRLIVGCANIHVYTVEPVYYANPLAKILGLIREVAGIGLESSLDRGRHPP